MNDKKRYAGDYEIIQSMSIGEKELVLGENMNAVDGKFYIGSNNIHWNGLEVWEMTVSYI